MATRPVHAGAIVCDDLGAATLPNSRAFAIRSARLGRVFSVDVALPMRPPPEGARLPVIFVLDGDASFGLAAQTAGSLQLTLGLLPPVLVVGIGYRAGGFGETFGGGRSRDFTPSRDERYLAMMRAAPAPFTLSADVELGGADAFRAFLLDELTPFLAESFHADPEDRTIVGMSLGGLFVLHSLFIAPASFRRYVAASPALWWDDRLLERLEAAYAATADDLRAHVFLSVGEQEEAQDPAARMVSNVEALATALAGRGYPGLRLTHRVFPEESHMTVFPAALSRGLCNVFSVGANAAPDWANLGDG